MPEVVRSGHVSAGADQVWDAISDVNAMLNWYPSAKAAEKIEGPDEGIGRIQRVKYKVGVRNAVVDSEVIEWEPEASIAWRQVREFLGSKQAPLLARNVTTRVEIESSEDTGCDVRVETRWDPVGLKGELATDTVLKPRAESLVGHVLDCVLDDLAG